MMTDKELIARVDQLVMEIQTQQAAFPDPNNPELAALEAECVRKIRNISQTHYRGVLNAQKK